MMDERTKAIDSAVRNFASVWQTATAAYDAGVAAERERWARVAFLAHQCAEWHLGDGDECGVIARELYVLLDGPNGPARWAADQTTQENTMNEHQAGALRQEADRELLEAAARAAGFGWDRDSEIWFGEPFVRGDWNPLVHDGDALRLAVKLRIDIQSFSDDGVRALVDRPGKALGVPCGPDGDRYAATRRAIVRAAASMGADNPCALTECQGKPRCARCQFYDAKDAAAGAALRVAQAEPPEFNRAHALALLSAASKSGDPGAIALAAQLAGAARLAGTLARGS